MMPDKRAAVIHGGSYIDKPTENQIRRDPMCTERLGVEGETRDEEDQAVDASTC